MQLFSASKQARDRDTVQADIQWKLTVGLLRNERVFMMFDTKLKYALDLKVM